MKKGLFISVIAASLMSVANAATYDRMPEMGITNVMDIEEHMNTTQEEEKNEYKEEKEEKKEKKEQKSEDEYSEMMGTAQEQNSYQNEEKNEYKEEYKSEKESAQNEAKEDRQEAQNMAQNAYETANQYANEGMEQAKEHAQEGNMTAMEAYENANEEAKKYEEQAREEAKMYHDEANETAAEYAQEAKKEAKEDREEAKNEAKNEKEKAKKLVEMIQEDMEDMELPDEVKEVLHEVEKAVKFYKKEELFEDLNITDPQELADQQLLAQLEEKVKEAERLRQKEVAQNIVKNQERVELPVAGEFVRYGDGQYDWVFVTQDGQVYKLAGVNTQDGTFSYEALPGVSGTVAPDGTVTFNATNADNQVASELNAKKMKGYAFAQYDDPNENGFDWVVVTEDGQIYKLEGYDPQTQSFIYTPVPELTAEPQGDEVVILPGT